MKNRLGILTTAAILFMINPVFAQDMASCCDTNGNVNTQLVVDASQLQTAGHENELLGNMTSIVREKLHHDNSVNGSVDQASAVKAGKQSKKSHQSKQ